jgi:sugar phosphate isomerase/epimerase
MSEVTTYGWPIEMDLAAYSRHGYKGIEIWLNKVARNGAPYYEVPSGQLSPGIVRDLVSDLAGSGLQAVSVVCAGLLTEPDDDEWQARVQHLSFTVRLAADIGASCVLVVPGNLHGTSRRRAVERAASALQEVLPTADRAGVDLAIEPLRPVHTDFVNTIPHALEIVELVNDRRCGLCLDTYQLWRGDEERDDVIREIGEAAAWARIVQVADSPPVPRSTEDRKVPGEGVLPLAEMLAELFVRGYDGWLPVEIMSTELWGGDQDELLARCRAGMADVIGHAEQLASSRAQESPGPS